jgi:hypothetical protein
MNAVEMVGELAGPEEAQTAAAAPIPALDRCEVRLEPLGDRLGEVEIAVDERFAQDRESRAKVIWAH